MPSALSDRLAVAAGGDEAADEVPVGTVNIASSRARFAGDCVGSAKLGLFLSEHAT